MTESVSTPAKWLAELFGTFWLVFGGAGTAVFAAKQVADATNDSGDVMQIQVGVGFLGVALAFGLTVVTMAYSVIPSYTRLTWTFVSPHNHVDFA